LRVRRAGSREQGAGSTEWRASLDLGSNPLTLLCTLGVRWQMSAALYPGGC